jgi:hypothetical protein
MQGKSIYHSVYFLQENKRGKEKNAANEVERKKG